MTIQNDMTNINNGDNIPVQKKRGRKPLREEIGIDQDTRLADRPERLPLHRQKILDAYTRDGYHRRWVNDKEDQINQFKKAGWLPVTSQEADGEPQIIIRPVGGGMRAILMEIEDIYFEADQKDKMRIIDKNEEDLITPKAEKNQYGFTTIKR